MYSWTPPDLSLIRTETILELECDAVGMEFESRPRTKGMKFSITVGGLYLRDHITAHSIMPVLVAPQMRVGLDNGHVTRHSVNNLSVYLNLHFCVYVLSLSLSVYTCVPLCLSLSLSLSLSRLLWCHILPVSLPLLLFPTPALFPPSCCHSSPLPLYFLPPPALFPPLSCLFCPLSCSLLSLPCSLSSLLLFFLPLPLFLCMSCLCLFLSVVLPCLTLSTPPLLSHSSVLLSPFPSLSTPFPTLTPGLPLSFYLPVHINVWWSYLSLFVFPAAVKMLFI